MLKPEKIKKLGMFTDIHWGRRSNSKIHNQDCLDFIDWFCDNIKDKGYTHLAFLGDWFESRSAINIETLEYSYKGLQKLNSVGLPTYFAVGNHDLHRRTTRDVHSVRMFQELSNIIIVDKPTVIDNILFSPYLFEEEYPQLLQYNDCYAWAGHFEFKNFVLTGHSMVMEHGPDHKMFAGPKKIFSGHFHKRQSQDNVHYIGNAFPMDLGDAGDYDRGMCTYFVNDDKVEYKNWTDCPKYYKTSLSKVIDDSWTPMPKMKVKCVIDGELGYQDAQDLREAMIATYNLRDFVLEEDKATKQGMVEGENFSVKEESLDFNDIDDLVVGLLEAAKTDKSIKVDIDELIAIYKSVIVESTEHYKSDVIFETLKFRNFLSFGNTWTEIDLSKTGTFHIVGENLDEGGSSGAGKSTLIAALSYCLFNQIPSKVSKDKLLNRTNDKKNTLMEVQLTFKRGTNSYIVRRFRGTSNGIQLFVNGKDETPANVNRGEDSFNAKIADIVGFSYNLFSQIILFNGNSIPFLDLAVGDQRNLIEELLKITTLSSKAALLKKIASETDKAIDMQKLLNKQLETQNENHRRHVKDANDRISRWESNRQLELSKINSDIDKLSKIDFQSEEELFAFIKNEEKQEQELKHRIQLIQGTLSGIERERFASAGELSTVTASIKQRDINREKIAKELIHLRDAKCPYCLQKFEEGKLKIADLEAQVISLDDAQQIEKLVLENITKQKDEFLTEQADKITSYKAEISGFQSQLIPLSKQIVELKSSLTYKTIIDLENAKNTYANIQNKLAELIDQVNPHIEAADNLIAEGEIKIDYEAVDVLQKKLDQQNFLVKLLTDKNSFIRKNIISKTIPFLNKQIGYYTEKLNLPHIILFQPDMSCEITQYGRELDHGNLSNGEKKKLNLSLCLAFRDVMTYLHSKVNLLLTDEIDGGSISGNDVDALIGLLKRKAWDDEIGIMVISHRPELEGRCDRNIVVRKESGFSTLILQPET